MIDTIKININLNDVPHNYENYLLKLDNYHEKTNRDGDKIITGYIKNFYVSLNSRGVRIEGSLTRYLFGDNFKSASKTQLIEGIKRLSFDTGLNLEEGKVGRLDISENILTIYPVKDYFDSLMELRYFKDRNIIKSTLKYVSTQRVITIYDKIAEMKASKAKIDEIFKDKNFLRFELSYSNHNALCQMLKLKKCSVMDVFSNYSKIIDEWLKQFNLIEKKMDSMVFDFDNLTTKKDIFKQLQIQGIIKLNGLQEVLKMIEVGKRRGFYDSYPNVATNIRSGLRKLMNTPNLVKNSPLNDELKKKMELIHFHAYSKVELLDVFK